LVLFVALAVACAVLVPGRLRAAPPEYELKIATLAPENSSLMQIFNEMNAELLKETGGKVGFKMYTGFVLGDEEDVLRKVRIGMMHGAVFTVTALTDINPDLRVTLIPFLFNDYGEVDHVFEKLDGEFKKGFSEKGFEILGWPELGFIYFMSREPISGLNDLKGKRVWAKANMPMARVLVEKAGVSPVAVNSPDVLMALQTNLLDVVYNSPYYALVTQWYTQVKYFTDLPLAYIGGALMIDRKAFERIPAPLRETTRKVCAKHLRRLSEKTRKDSAEAKEIILKRGVSQVVPQAAQVQEFKELSDRAMSDLDPKFLPHDTWDKVKAMLAELRTGHPGQK
jgi:TRAP-type transport system periplasmic protein